MQEQGTTNRFKESLYIIYLDFITTVNQPQADLHNSFWRWIILLAALQATKIALVQFSKSMNLITCYLGFIEKIRKYFSEIVRIKPYANNVPLDFFHVLIVCIL